MLFEEEDNDIVDEEKYDYDEEAEEYPEDED
jgi:hypothetical protein